MIIRIPLEPQIIDLGDCKLQSADAVAEATSVEITTGKRKLIFEENEIGILIVSQVMVDAEGNNIGEPIGIGIV